MCKSVSTENNDRGNNRTCIADATGLTGRTFDGVRRYVERFRPKLVICENVTGLLKRFLGAEPQIHDLAGNAFSTPVCMTVCLAVIMTAI